MQASAPLGVDDITRIEIENKICREGGPLPDCFSCPMEHVLCLLEEVISSFNQWRKGHRFTWVVMGRNE